MAAEDALNAAVIGAGSWGTALAALLARKGHCVTLWARDPQLANEITARHENFNYLPGVPLPEGLQVTADLRELRDREAYFLAVPSFAMREIARKFYKMLGSSACNALWVSLTKGLEYERADHKLVTMTQVLREELHLPPDRVLALSGPSFADEVAKGQPTAVVLAGRDVSVVGALQRALMTERFRVYITGDVLGVELGGAAKNVIALAAGASDGLGFGVNAKGALVARGLVEMTRLGTALGARKETFFGLAGLGDLVITCMSAKSRNHQVGERIGQGESLDEILKSMTMVAEGVYATRAIHHFARERGLELPITRAVYEVLYEGASPLEKLTELMTREPKREEI
jgi:glycerol-3-phosphate dehydrogenase (NAD(P)+)